MPIALEDEAQLTALFDGVATLEAHPLLPELRFHQCPVVEDIWLKVEALTGRRCEPPFWGFVWPGGLALARYLLDRPDLLANRRLLDIGTGNGVVAVAAALGGARVVANDIDPVALTVTRLHARLNGVTLETLGGDLLDLPPSALPFDLITIGDACYEETFAARLFPWMRAAQSAGIEVLMGDPGRNFLPAQGLLTLQAYEIPTLVAVEGKPMRHARVFTLEPV